MPDGSSAIPPQLASAKKGVSAAAAAQQTCSQTKRQERVETGTVSDPFVISDSEEQDLAPVSVKKPKPQPAANDAPERDPHPSLLALALQRKAGHSATNTLVVHEREVAARETAVGAPGGHVEQRRDARNRF